MFNLDGADDFGDIDGAVETEPEPTTPVLETIGSALTCMLRLAAPMTRSGFIITCCSNTSADSQPRSSTCAAIA